MNASRLALAGIVVVVFALRMGAAHAQVAVGGTVEVVNTGGLGLKVRGNPGTASGVRASVPDGTRMRVSGGPTQKDGYVWWQVSGGFGTGWVAANWIRPASTAPVANPTPQAGPMVVVNPLVSVSPSGGPRGTMFSQPGQGFIANSTATVHYRKPDGAEYPPVRQQTDAQGRYSRQWTAPADAQTGTYQMWAVDDRTGRSSPVVSFTVTAAPQTLPAPTITTPRSPSPVTTPAAVPAPPTVASLMPNPVVGQDALQLLTVRGTGFVPGSLVVLRTGGTAYVIPPERTKYVSVSEIGIRVNVTRQPAVWTVEVRNPDNRVSTAVAFQVASSAGSLVAAPTPLGCPPFATVAGNDYEPTLRGYCTWYVADRWLRATGSPLPSHRDATNWFDDARAKGLRTGDMPEIRSVMVLGPTTSNSAGHVAWVESVDGARRTFVVSEMNWGSLVDREQIKTTNFCKVTMRTLAVGQNTGLRGFIYTTSMAPAGPSKAGGSDVGLSTPPIPSATLPTTTPSLLGLEQQPSTEIVASALGKSTKSGGLIELTAPTGVPVKVDLSGKHSAPRLGRTWAFHWFVNGNSVSGEAETAHRFTEGLHKVRLTVVETSGTAQSTPVTVSPLTLSSDIGIRVTWNRDQQCPGRLGKRCYPDSSLGEEFVTSANVEQILVGSQWVFRITSRSSIGALKHDRCCTDNPGGWNCPGNRAVCKLEWDRAKADWQGYFQAISLGRSLAWPQSWQYGPLDKDREAPKAPSGTLVAGEFEAQYCISTRVRQIRGETIATALHIPVFVCE